MANDALKEVFSSMHYYIITNTSLDFVMDALLSKKIISHSDYSRLREVRTTRTEFCRNALSLLYNSSNPQTFIRLRLALLDDYPWIVDEIDKELPTLTSRLHQPQLGQSTDDECYILPRSRRKNQLYEALEGQHYEEASRLIGEYREADLVECLQTTEKTYKSCLHLIAGMSDREWATKLCGQLLERVTNAKNRECLLNVRTVDEFDMDGRKFHARVAAIHIAAYNDNSGVVRLLCQEYGVNANSEIIDKLKKDIIPLEFVPSTEHTELANNNKVDVNAGRQTDGDTPLHVAVYIGNAEVVKQLLDSKADVNARKHIDGATPLVIAAQQRRTEIVKLLLEHGAEVNTSVRTNGADNGDTPLHAAAWNGSTEIVRMLLNSGADVNARKLNDGATPLYLASLRGHSDIVKLLLENKATM